MYNVSADYLEKLHSLTHVEHCRGTIGGESFDDSNIIKMNYTNRCSDTEDITLGSCYIGQIEASLVNVYISRGNWYNQQMTVEVGLEIDEETIEWVPLGRFIIKQAVWDEIGINITASDKIVQLEEEEFDGQYTQLQAGTIYEMARFACGKCGLTFGMTRQEAEALPNGTSIFTLYKENSFKTYRDFMSALSQLAGGFVYANRDGQIIIKSFLKPENTVDTITASDRMAGVEFSDYNTLYNGVRVEVNNGKDSYIIKPYGVQTWIDLGQQPFLQIGLSETIKQYAENIAAAVRTIKTTPFHFSTLSTICYDIGDYITAAPQLSTGYGPFTCLICSVNWTFKELTEFEGYGSNPDLKTGKSKAEKQLDSISSQVNSNEFKYYTYTNIAEVNVLQDTETEIGNIIFASNKNTDVDITTEIILDAIATSSSQERVTVYQDTPDPLDPGGDPITSEIGYWLDTVTDPIIAHVRYYLDGVLQFHEPIETMDEDGVHTLHYDYLLHDIDESQAHTWRVTLELTDGAGAIAPDGILLTLGGQGLVGEDRWDGTVNASDEIPTAAISGLSPATITDIGPTITKQTPTTVTASDSVPTAAIAGMEPAEISEGNINIILRNELFNFVTEDKTANITNEGKTANITTEET